MSFYMQNTGTWTWWYIISNLVIFFILLKDKLQHDILKIAQDHVAQAKAVVAKDVGRFVTDYI